MQTMNKLAHLEKYLNKKINKISLTNKWIAKYLNLNKIKKEVEILHKKDYLAEYEYINISKR
jgi:hypothetical protein